MKLWKHSGGIAPSQIYDIEQRSYMFKGSSKTRGTASKGVWWL